MATPTIGAAFSAAGLVPAGFGVPATGDQKAAGTPPTARFIDPATGDYEFGSDGRLRGMTGIEQRVQLAVRTLLGSSALASLGIDLSLDRATDDVQRRVQNAVEQALASMVRSGEIAIVSVTVQRPLPSRLVTRVSWTDLTTGTARESVIGG